MTNKKLAFHDELLDVTAKILKELNGLKKDQKNIYLNSKNYHIALRGWMIISVVI
jgi:hypothetical protein